MNQYKSLQMVPKWESVLCMDKAQTGTHVDQQDFYQRNSWAHSTITVHTNTRPLWSWKLSWNGRINCWVESYGGHWPQRSWILQDSTELVTEADKVVGIFLPLQLQYHTCRWYVKSSSRQPVMLLWIQYYWGWIPQ